MLKKPCFLQQRVDFFPQKQEKYHMVQKISCHPEDMCTDIKQNKNFFLKIFIFRKNKGGASKSFMKKRRNFYRQKFLADKMDRDPKNRPNYSFDHVRYPPSRNCKLDQKQKSYGILKLVNCQFSKIVLPPPLWG